MTSISSFSSFQMPSSPRAQMNQRIDAAVSAGTISETDEAALSTALDAIDSSIQSSSGSTSRLDPSEMKERVDSLIDEQVKAGTLTEDQAAELQSLFAQGGPTATSASSESGSVEGVEGMGGPGGPRGPGGPPPPPPSSEEEDEDDSSTTTASASDQLDALISFLENLRSQMQSDTYGSSSSSTASSDNSGLVIDAVA